MQPLSVPARFPNRDPGPCWGCGEQPRLRNGREGSASPAGDGAAGAGAAAALDNRVTGPLPVAAVATGQDGTGSSGGTFWLGDGKHEVL